MNSKLNSEIIKNSLVNTNIKYDTLEKMAKQNNVTLAEWATVITYLRKTARFMTLSNNLQPINDALDSKLIQDKFIPLIRKQIKEKNFNKVIDLINHAEKFSSQSITINL